MFDLIVLKLYNLVKDFKFKGGSEMVANDSIWQEMFLPIKMFLAALVIMIAAFVIVTAVLLMEAVLFFWKIYYVHFFLGQEERSVLAKLRKELKGGSLNEARSTLGLCHQLGISRRVLDDVWEGWDPRVEERKALGYGSSLGL